MNKKIQELLSKAQAQAKGVTFLNTPDQLKQFYLDGLKTYKEWRALASIEDWLPVDQKFLQNFRIKLNDHKINTRVIFKRNGLQFEPGKLEYRHIKVIPDSYRFRSSIDILSDKILIMNPHLSVLGIILEGEALIDVFIDMFDLLWASLPENK